MTVLQRNQKASAELCMARVLPVPSLRVKLSRLDTEWTKPMYAKRLVSTACMLRPPSQTMLHNCHSHLTFTVCMEKWVRYSVPCFWTFCHKVNFCLEQWFLTFFLFCGPLLMCDNFLTPSVPVNFNLITISYVHAR